MKFLLKIAMILGFATACAGSGGSGVAPKMPEGTAKQMPNEQLNPRSDSSDASGVDGSGMSNGSTNPSSTGTSTTPTNNGTGTTTNSGGTTVPSGSGTVPTTGTGLPDISSLPGMPCTMGQACASKADLIKHCQQKIIIPNC